MVDQYFLLGGIKILNLNSKPHPINVGWGFYFRLLKNRWY